jgi:hypothetical protein
MFFLFLFPFAIHSRMANPSTNHKTMRHVPRTGFFEDVPRNVPTLWMYLSIRIRFMLYNIKKPSALIN